jgi:PAS domain S-box-containing protein
MNYTKRTKYLLTNKITNLEQRISTFQNSESWHKKVEIALRTSEEKYRKLIESSNDAIFLINAKNGIIFDANKRAEEMLGMTRSEIIGLNQTKIHPKDYAVKHKELFRRIVRQKKATITTEEMFLCHKDKHKIPVSVSANTIRIGGKKIIQAVFRDITARKKMEDAIRTSEERFRELFNNMGSGVAVYEVKNKGKDFIFKDFNRAAEKIEKIKKDKIINKNVLAVFPGMKDFGLFKTFQKVWRTGRPERFPSAFYKDQRIDGWRDNHVYKLPTGEIVAVYDDVTQDKIAEQKIIHLNRIYSVIRKIDQLVVRTKNTQKLFNESCKIMVHDGKFDMAWIGMVEEKTHMVHPVASYGKTAKEYLKNIKISTEKIPIGLGPTGTCIRNKKYFINPDITMSPFMKPWKRKFIQSGYKANAAFPLIVCKKAIGAFTFYSSDTHFFDKQEIELLEELTSDISYAIEFLGLQKEKESLIRDLRCAKNELEMLNKALEQKVIQRTNELKITQEKLIKTEKIAIFGKLSESLSHELRNPLAIINNVVYLLGTEKTNIDSKMKLAYLNVLKKQISNANKIIDDVTDFTKPRELRKEMILVTDIIDEIISEIKPHGGIKIIKDYKRVAPIKIDSYYIHRMFFNIITNSIQAIENNGTVKISVSKKKRYIETIISDTGSGISQNDIKMIFEPMFSKKAGQVGLGLSLAKDIIERHNGAIKVKSILGKGTDVIIKLPIVKT